MVKHVLGKDESQVRFLLRAPEIKKIPNMGIFLLNFTCFFDKISSGMRVSYWGVIASMFTASEIDVKHLLLCVWQEGAGITNTAHYFL